MEASQDTTNVLTWAGSPATLDDFAEEIDVYALGTKLGTGETCGPRIAQAHAPGTPQKKLAMGLGVTVLAAPDGGQKIVGKLRETLSARPEAEILEHLTGYLFRCHRSRCESIPSYILREDLLRERAIKAVKTVKIGNGRGLCVPSPSDGKRGGAATGAHQHHEFVPKQLKLRSGVDGAATVDWRSSQASGKLRRDR